MSLLTIAFTLLFYFAAAVLVVGLVMRIRLYATTPTPLRIPTTPAPTTAPGVVRRMFFEVTLFNSLFKSNKWIWIFGWLFHAALLLVLLRHLRYFTDPVWSWVSLVQPFGAYAAFAMVAGLAGLWARRFLVDRVRYISSPSDHLMLALLLAIGLSGLGMKYVAATDIVSVKAFFSRPDVLRLAAAAERPDTAAAPVAGGAVDDYFSIQQAAARSRRFLQPDAQPDRQSARKTAPADAARGHETGRLRLLQWPTSKPQR